MMLKPCPFCGRKPMIIGTGNHFPKSYFRVVCEKCFAMQGALYDTKEEAVEVWNRRAGEQDG